MNYIRHKIYCDLDYKSLTSIAADYFVSKRYYDYSTGAKFKNTKKIYDVGYCQFSVIMFRSFIWQEELDGIENLGMNTVSAAVVVSSVNLKGQYSRRVRYSPFTGQKTGLDKL